MSRQTSHRTTTSGIRGLRTQMLLMMMSRFVVLHPAGSGPPERARLRCTMTIADSVTCPLESRTRKLSPPRRRPQVPGLQEMIEAFVRPRRWCGHPALHFNFLRPPSCPIRRLSPGSKQASSITTLFANRLRAGRGHPAPGRDFDLMGCAVRAAGVTNGRDCIRIIRGLTTGACFEFPRQVLRHRQDQMTPAPSRPIPILIGATSTSRCAGRRWRDNWMRRRARRRTRRPAGETAGYRRAEGRTGDDHQVHVISMDAYKPDGIQAARGQSVTDVMVGFRLPTSSARTPTAGEQDPTWKYADKMISKMWGPAEYRGRERPPLRPRPGVSRTDPARSPGTGLVGVQGDHRCHSAQIPGHSGEV